MKAEDSIVRDYLEEILNSGKSPEDVCADRPDLLGEVQRRLRKVRQVEAQVEQLFPSSGVCASTQGFRRNHLNSETPDLPGYEIHSVLGRGGMGVVYRARQTRLNRFVAVKMLLSGSYASPAELARFAREAEAIAGLKNAHIVQIYDVGDVLGQPYYTMELVEGGTLAEKLGGHPQPVCDTAEMIAVLARAVQTAHDGGVVHRDLKPANILLTTDGTPKISDFGLARFLDADGGLTLSGARMGTPNYMAPEQVAGNEIGSSVDIYALGTLIYEMVTGQPPFRGGSLSEMERRLVMEEPIPPSKLNRKVPRDLETICLKCLQKEPRQRYLTAGELADDLTRFLRHEAILARPVSRFERLVRWTRRNRISVALILMALTLCGVLVAEAIHLSSLAVARRVEKDRLVGRLESGLQLVQQNRLEAARAILDRLGDGDFEDLHRQIEQAQAGLDLVEKLDSIRFSRVTSGDLKFYRIQADLDYQDAFASAGLIMADDSAIKVAERVRRSIVGKTLVSALDDWAFCAVDGAKRDWLLDVARRSDPDPSGWRDRIRDSAAWSDVAALMAMTRKVPISGDAVSLLLILGERLRFNGGDATDFLKRVQQEHPEDFWCNLVLGDALLMPAPDQADGFYRAALASRPNAAVGYTAVGDALRFQKMPDVAVDYYQKALALDPTDARAQTNLGNAWKDLGHLDEAISCYRNALILDPHYAWAYFDLGNAFKEKGMLDEALENLRQSRDAQPENTAFQHGARSVLVKTGHGHEALRDWKRTLDSGHENYDAWSGYAELCLYEGNVLEWERACDKMLDTFETTSEAGTAEGIARCCALRVTSPERLARASVLVDTAVNYEPAKAFWYYRYYLFAKGLTEYRLGKLDSVITIMEGDAAEAIGPCPQLIVAMAQHQQGKFAAASQSLAAAIAGGDWREQAADSRDPWIYHILRREAEALILTNLNAFLAGKYVPQSNDERLSFLGESQFQNRYAACSQLYADAFASAPELRAKLSFAAARAAAIAGCGRSADNNRLSQNERTQWRIQAVQWLRWKLDNLSANPDRSIPEVRSYFVQQLMSWKADADFNGLRDPRELQKFSSAEQEQCKSLWNAVDAEISSLQDAE